MDKIITARIHKNLFSKGYRYPKIDFFAPHNGQFSFRFGERSDPHSLQYVMSLLIERSLAILKNDFNSLKTAAL